MLPASMGVPDDSPDAQARLAEIAMHARSVVVNRALSPADQVRALMVAAASVIVANAAGPGRDATLAHAVLALTASVVGAGRALDGMLAAMPVEGRA